MKRIDISQGIAVLANLGVIAGIVFLGFELRQNNELLEAQVEQLEAQANQTALANRTSMNLVRNEGGLAEAFVAGLSGAGLTPIQQFRLQNYYLAYLAQLEWSYLRSQEGLLPDFEESLASLQYGYAYFPDFDEFWRALEPGRNAEFARWFNQNVANRPLE